MVLLQGWLNRRPPQEADVLLALFDSVFSDLYLYARNNLEAKMIVLQCMQIRQVRASVYADPTGACCSACRSDRCVLQCMQIRQVRV